MTPKESAYILGYQYEDRVARRLREMGYDAERIGGASHQPDIIIRSPRSITIEVKTSRRTRAAPGRWGYQFFLNRGARGVHGDFVVLVCVTEETEPEYFIFPASAIGQISKIAIYDIGRGGRWAKYRGAWECIK